MKKLKIIITKTIPIIGILGTIYLLFLITRPTYYPGECALSFDSYIWRIESFSRRTGIYKVRGWENKTWGSVVDLDRKILENEKYKFTICPDPTLFQGE